MPEDGAAGPELATYAGTNIDVRELLFDGASTEAAFFTFQSPKGADETEALVIEISYQSKGTSGGTVRWQAAAVAVGDGDATDAALGSSSFNDSNPGTTANVTTRTGELTVTPGGTWAAEDDITVRVRRIGGTDTNTDDCGLLNDRIHYTLNSGTDD